MYDWIREKLASIHTTARHTFHYQVIAAHINQQFRQTLMLKVAQTALLWLVSEACQISTSAHCSGVL